MVSVITRVSCLPFLAKAQTFTRPLFLQAAYSSVTEVREITGPVKKLMRSV